MMHALLEPLHSDLPLLPPLLPPLNKGLGSVSQRRLIKKGKLFLNIVVKPAKQDLGRRWSD